jgi:hypothetical protein
VRVSIPPGSGRRIRMPKGADEEGSIFDGYLWRRSGWAQPLSTRLV